MAVVRDHSDMFFNILESFIWEPVVNIIVEKLGLWEFEESDQEGSSFSNWVKYIPNGANLDIDQRMSLRQELIEAFAPLASRASIKPERYSKRLHRLHLMREKGYIYLIAARNATLTRVLLEETRMDEDENVLEICETINDFLYTQVQGSLLVPVHGLGDRSNHPEPVVFDLVSAAQFFSSENNLLKSPYVGERITPIGTRMFGFLGDRNRDKSGSLKIITINGEEELVCMVPIRPADFLGWLGGTVCTKHRISLVDRDKARRYRCMLFWRGLYLLIEIGDRPLGNTPNMNRSRFTSDRDRVYGSNCVFAWRIDSHTAISGLPGRYPFIFSVLGIASCPGFTLLSAVSSFWYYGNVIGSRIWYT